VNALATFSLRWLLPRLTRLRVAPACKRTATAGLQPVAVTADAAGNGPGPSQSHADSCLDHAKAVA
jgi:hypothetical protein